MPGLVIGVTEFIDEMRGVLDQWVERFHLIIEPAPKKNIVTLRVEARR